MTVYAEPGEGVTLFCSGHDHGVGFDTSAVPEWRGLADSVRGRIDEIGGRFEVHSRIGHGTEVLLWVP